MEIRVLRYFLEIAREGNMSRAAERLHVTQPTLSKQMKNLEQELGKNYLCVVAPASVLLMRVCFYEKEQKIYWPWLTKSQTNFRQWMISQAVIFILAVQNLIL